MGVGNFDLQLLEIEDFVFLAENKKDQGQQSFITKDHIGIRPKFLFKLKSSSL